jgi:hypothetical protein
VSVDAPELGYTVPPAPSRPAEPTQPDPAALAAAADRRRRARTVLDVAVVAACVVFALWHLQPDLLLRNTTPAGGDMGAHVWGPAYLRDHLLPHGQVAGWAPDWYAGFPAYQFYMVLPSLLIVALNAGVHGWLALVPAAVGVLLGSLALFADVGRRARWALGAGAVLAFALVGLPYGVAFKLVSVSGVATLPIAVYLFGRLSGLRFPTPAVLAVGSLPFLFYRGFTIYGGNVASTLAGEFAFSMSLSLAVVYLGLVFKGLETGRYRALTAVTLAATGLCHLIPAFWALGATAVVVAVRFRRSSSPGGLGYGLLAGAAFLAMPAAFLAALSPIFDTRVTTLTLAPAAVGVVLALAGLWILSDSVRWLTPTLAVGGLLSMWWVAPFFLRRAFLNDMGWEKLPYLNADPPETIWKYLLPRATPDIDLRWAFALALVGAGLSLALRLRAGIFLAVVTAGVGVVFIVAPEGRLWNGRLLPFFYLTAILLAVLAVSETLRTVMAAARAPERETVRPGWGAVAGVLGGIAVLAAAITVLAGHLPDAAPTTGVDVGWVYTLALVGGFLCAVGRLWEGVALAVLAALVANTFPDGGSAWWDFLGRGSWAPVTFLASAALVVATVAGLVRIVTAEVDTDRTEPVGAGAFTALLALAVTVVLVGVPLGQLPFSETIENGYAWPRFSPWKVQGTPGSFVPSWASWNYSGYEGKPSYREYYDVVRTMQQVGEDEGCGRAFWEYEKELDRYGTPMALMLLPFWTDGCIGSMEGLYFEASATTPFHFLTQVELSTAPSAAQRDLPYGGFDITKGVQHLQMLGVKYYMATSDNAISLARSNEDLTEIAASGPWVVFEVADSELVTPLDNEPAVVEGITDSQVDWVEEPHDESGRFGGPATRWFTDPTQWDLPLAAGGPDDWQRVGVGEEPDARPLDPVEVSDIVTGDQSIAFDVDEVGIPVLVKASYFPNWTASGADGPYRVAPNLMVVVPTEGHVELTYGRTGVEWLSYALTLMGVAGLVLLIRHPVARFSSVIASSRGGGRQTELAGPEPDPEPELALDPEPDTDPEPEPDPDPEADPDPDSEPDPDATVTAERPDPDP